LGVATTRPIMAVFFATPRLTELTPQQFFGPAMWLGFVSSYIAGEAWINYNRAINGDRSRSSNGLPNRKGRDPLKQRAGYSRAQVLARFRVVD
jgi:hypothetical protein